MRPRTWTTGPKASALRKDSTVRIGSGPQWDGSAGRRLNRSTVCIVGDVGKWLGNCAQDGRPWLRKNCARGLTTLGGDYRAGILRRRWLTKAEGFGDTGERLALVR